MPIIILGKIEKKNIIDATQEQEIDTKNMHNKIQLSKTKFWSNVTITIT